jgi:hypothetical protein
MFDDNVLYQFGKETCWEDKMESFHLLVHEKEAEKREMKVKKGMRRKKCYEVMVVRQDRHRFPY